MAKFAVILPAAGKSRRFGDPRQKKIYADLDGRAVWLRAIEPFLRRDDVHQTIIAIAPEDRELFERRYRANVAFLNILVIEGGEERSDSIANALERLDPSCDHVAIHDAARPCVTSDQITAVFAAAEEHGAAILAVPAADTLKRVDESRSIIETVPRAGIWCAQTPQVFRRELLLDAYRRRGSIRESVTDDAQLIEALGHRCVVVQSSAMNLKITTAEDLRLAEAILKALPEPQQPKPMHPFADDRQMWSDAPAPKPGDLFQGLE